MLVQVLGLVIVVNGVGIGVFFKVREDLFNGLFGNGMIGIEWNFVFDGQRVNVGGVRGFIISCIVGEDIDNEIDVFVLDQGFDVWFFFVGNFVSGD